MNVNELSREELTILKQNYYMHKLEKQGEGISYGELADIDVLVSDDEIYNEYAGTIFCEQDFKIGEEESK